MPRAAPVVPEDAAILCEGCGYIVSGLPGDSRCPECAKPIDESRPELRTLPDWERDDGGRSTSRRFFATTRQILLRPTPFYRTLATRHERRASSRFARRHMIVASLLLGVAALIQVRLFGLPGFDALPNWIFWRDRTMPTEKLAAAGGLLIALGLIIYGALAVITALAARLTAWEAAYRGLRLPLAVVRRGLDYHAPHYLPPAIVIFATVVAYQSLLTAGVLTDLSGPRYLYIFAAEILLAGAYLFKTYWTGMRNMMFANR